MPTERAYHIVTPETWELARSAYLSGLSGSVVARRFGITEHALRKRAARHGWTKQAYTRARAAPDAAGPGAPAVPRPEIAVTSPALAAAALRRAGEALIDGRPYEAQAYVKAAEAVARLEPLLPEIEDQESLEDVRWRHQATWDATFDIARDLAERIVAGLPLPDCYAERAAAAWPGVGRPAAPPVQPACSPGRPFSTT